MLILRVCYYDMECVFVCCVCVCVCVCVRVCVCVVYLGEQEVFFAVRLLEARLLLHLELVLHVLWREREG